MKKKYAIILLHLFFSSILFGQIDNKNNSAPNENCNHPQVSIDKIVWNADLNTLENIMWEYPYIPYPIWYVSPDLTPYNSSTFHVALLKFGDYGPEPYEEFEFDASVYLNYYRDKPIYFVYPVVEGLEVFRKGDHILKFQKKPINETSTNKSNSGGGVITTVGVKGRSSIMGKISSVPGGGPTSLGHYCMNLEMKNRITNETCISPQPIYSTKCAQASTHSKVEADDALFINSYPNPVRNHLFVEVEGLDVQAINFLNLQGQSLNHQVDVSNMESTWKVDTNKLEAGLYILQVETDAGSSVKKIYVQ